MKLIIELKSDALPGAGEGLSGIIDTEINSDEFGIPYIPGKRIKGILRESALELSKAKLLDHDVKDLFGKEGSQEGTAFRISDGYLDMARVYRGFLKFAAHNENLDWIFNKEAVLEHFTYLRSQTEIENGTARENSLRTFRVLEKGLIFHFDVEIPGQYEEDFKKICKVTRRFGISRTRGLGEIKVTADSTAAAGQRKEATKREEKPFPNSETCKLILDIENHGQILLASQVGKNQETESFIPGNALLGTLANAYIKANNPEFPHQDDAFRDIFLSGKVIFSNAYPLVEDMENICPVPVSLVKDKDRGEYFDLAYPEDYERVINEGVTAKNVKGEFARFTGVDFDTFSTEKEIEYHHRRPENKGKGHAGEGEGEGEFFQFSVLKANQRFQAQITGPTELLKLIAQLLSNQQWFYLGKSKTAQYGKCSISLKEIISIKSFAGSRGGFSKRGWHPQPIHGQPDVVLSEASSQKFAEKTRFQELLVKELLTTRGEKNSTLTETRGKWDPGKTTVFTLISDMILRSEQGFICPDPALFRDEVAECLKMINQGNLELEIEKKFLNFTEIGGFLGIWRMPKIQYKALKAGSVIVMKNCSGKTLDITPLMNKAFGVNTGEGYGQVKIDWHGNRSAVYRPHEPKSPDFPKHNLSHAKEFIKSIFLKRLEMQLSDLAVKEAGNSLLPTNSFIGRMALFYKNAKNFNELNSKYLQQLRERGKRQLEKIEKTLKIKNTGIQKDNEKIQVKQVNQEEVKQLIKGGKVYQGLTSPHLRKVFEKAEIHELFFLEETINREEILFGLYKRYAAVFFRTLNLLNRR